MVALLRHPAVLLLAVAAVIGLVWYVLGQPASMPQTSLVAGGKLDCVSYAPAPVRRAAADPDETVPPERIEAELAQLTPHTNCLRTYTVGGGLDRVPEVADAIGFNVMLGIALGTDRARNREEVDAAIAVALAQRPAVGALVVGSEVLSRGDLAAAELVEIIRHVRNETGLPVTYADTWETWLSQQQLADAVDFITVHVPLYWAEFPVAAADAVEHLGAAREKVAARFPGKELLIGEVGWPSAGPMREGARPSLANQARVIQGAVAAAEAGNFRLNVFEAFDQAWRRQVEGAAGGHWGLLAAVGTPKFRWGEPVRDHPLWFYQGLTGILFAFVIFAAGFLAARSLGPGWPRGVDWLPVAPIALLGGLFAGWAIADIPLQSQSAVDWIYLIFIISIMILTPPTAAAAAVLRTPFEGFGAALDPSARLSVGPLARIIALLLALTVVTALQIALVIVFDPGRYDFLFAALTGPAAALAVLALSNPSGTRRAHAAEIAAAALLSGAALLIVVKETVWNWQALWFAAVLLALGWACWRARGVRKP